MKCCLTIAGSDSGGGAGIQADLKVFHEIGCFGSSVITCVTAQNTQRISSIFPLPPKIIFDQLEAVLEDLPVIGIKIGMVYSSEIIREISRALIQYKKRSDVKIVLDPVMISKSGALLLSEEAIERFKCELIPLATVFTPNLYEASYLLQKEIYSQLDIEMAAKSLCQLGAHSVVLKGGHAQNEIQSNDFFYGFSSGDIIAKWFYSDRVSTINTHGTGCSLSSAICAFLSQGYSLPESVREAKQFLTNKLLAGKKYSIGKGYGPAVF